MLSLHGFHFELKATREEDGRDLFYLQVSQAGSIPKQNANILVFQSFQLLYNFFRDCDRMIQCHSKQLNVKRSR